ncbi:MAG: hydroxymethylbilane synthase [Gammaproteobacteria bacterium]|nr:hydroxymethylbilane synthase [Gammaproteobacteria bacterium]
MSRIRIATRESQLALWQANEVSRLLSLHHPDIDVEIIGMTTEGDRFLQASLAAAGGKGLFVKELEQCLLDDNADIAVHSMKDVPYELPASLEIHTILEREDPRDALVSNHYKTLDELPSDAIVGTSSTRRECQIRALRADLKIQPLRGNVNTRLKKLDEGQYDAIILASAGLKRLGFEDRIVDFIATDTSLPAIGQGAIGIECRDNDLATKEILAPLHHEPTSLCVIAERGISTALSANCHLPIAAHATKSADSLTLNALVGLPDGSKILRASASGSHDQITQVIQQVINELLKLGANELIDSLREE